MLNTVERQLFKLIRTRGGSDNQTTCNIRKIYHLDYSNMQYCITNYENTSFTVHIHSDLLYIISAGSIVITHFFVLNLL